MRQTPSFKDGLKPLGIWWVLGTFACVLQGSYFWFFVLFSLMALNLFLLSKGVASLLELVSYSQGRTGAILWFFAKILVFGFVTYLLYAWNDQMSLVEIVFGLGTLIFVPIMGGIRFHLKEIKHAR